MRTLETIFNRKVIMYRKANFLQFINTFDFSKQNFVLKVKTCTLLYKIVYFISICLHLVTRKYAVFLQYLPELFTESLLLHNKSYTQVRSFTYKFVHTRSIGLSLIAHGQKQYLNKLTRFCLNF